jgi:hypothetical protein
MKLKVKFDSQSIKEFFIHHTEKIVFGGVLLILVLLGYRAMGREQLNFKPEDLTKAADDADRHIQSTPPKETRTLTDYLKKGEGIRTPIEEQLYQYVAVWDPLLFGGKALRGAPPLFPVEELRVAAGHGAVPARAGTGSSEGGFGSGGMMPGGMSEPGMMGMPGMMGGTGQAMEGLRWVVLTGVIPDAKQREEALASFEGTELPTPNWDRRQDIPEVVYYKVERAEVSSESDGQQLNWTPIHVLKAMLQAKQFGGTTRDVVPDRFIRNTQSAYLAFPLPPVANHTWGEEVAHEPAIPLGPSGPQMGMPGSEMGPGMPMGSGMPMGPTGGRPKPKPGAGGEKEPPKSEELPDAPMLNTTQGMGMGMGMGSMPGGPGMGEPGSSMGSGSPVLMPGPEGYSGMPGSQGQVMEETRVRLFRFFDFTVEPGKRYKYRVKLMFTNPNHKLPTRLLQSAELAANQLLENDAWSDASEAIAVPRDARVLAGPIKTSLYSEPKATLGVAFFEMSSGAEHFEEFKDVMRGQVLNYFGRPLHKDTPPVAMSGMPGMPGMMEPGSSVDAMMMPPMGPEGGPPPRKKERTKPKPAPAASDKKVDYLTDSILLDMIGGRKLPGRDRDATEPGRFLLLDPDGKLVIINELDCAEEVKAFNDAKKPPAASGYPGMMPGMEGSMPPEMMMPGSMPPEMMPADGGRRKPTRKGGSRGGGSAP